MSKINYELKSDVIKSGLCEIQKDVSKAVYVDYINKKYLTNNTSKLSLDESMSIQAYYETYYPDEWNEARKINYATYSRVKRLRSCIKSIIRYPSLFLTLTFTDGVLKSTSSDSRRRYVNRFLNALDCKYVANIDFGKKNGREHYHAVVRVEKIDYSLWQYGAINGLRVRLDKTSSAECLAKYVAKLTNHAIKETTKRCAIMYSRKKYKDYPDDVTPCILPDDVDKCFAS